MPGASSVESPPRFAAFPKLGRVCRFGLSTRGNTRLDAEDVLEAIRRGVSYLNWCGYADGLSAAMRRIESGSVASITRDDVFLAVQLSARTAAGAVKELNGYLAEAGTRRIDVVTYYYMESADEWGQINAPGGVADVLEAARKQGKVGAIGITSHQRKLAAELARSSDRVDLLMIRYNAAHRGAEAEVFPITHALGLPVVAYTGLRWGALLESTIEDPVGFEPARAPDWYRFVLANPHVTVGIMAPNGRAELEENLTVLDDWRGLSRERYRELAAHGDRVRRHGGGFP